MEEEDKNINKLLMIEKAVNEMIPVREQIAELKEWEADVS